MNQKQNGEAQRGKENRITGAPIREHVGFFQRIALGVTA